LYQKSAAEAIEPKKTKLHIIDSELISMIDKAVPTITNKVATAGILIVSQKE
jgi:hypothetical protein